MTGEISLFGLYMPWLMVLCAAALGLLWAVRRLFARVGVYRWVWHAALFDTAVYVLLLYGLCQLPLGPFLSGLHDFS